MLDFLMTIATVTLVFGAATVGVALTAVAILKLSRALKGRDAEA